MPNIEIKAALVTGASHGIGQALAINLLQDDWTVFGTGRDIQSLMELQTKFPQFIPIQADFRKNEDIMQVVKTIKDSGLQLSLNIQNAGMKSPPRPLHEYKTCEEIDEVTEVNLSAPMKLTSLLIDNMLPYSRILYVTSRAATLNLKESSTYCATKAALDVISNIQRQELKEKNIGVASIIPGEVDTQIQEILRRPPFHLSHLFKKAYESGQLIKPEICASFIKWFVCEFPFEQYTESNIPISIYDDWHKKCWLTDDKNLPPFPF